MLYVKKKLIFSHAYMKKINVSCVFAKNPKDFFSAL